MDHLGWLKTQKERMKAGEKDALLAALEIHLEPVAVEDKDAPVCANGLWGDYWDTYAKQDDFPSL